MPLLRLPLLAAVLLAACVFPAVAQQPAATAMQPILPNPQLTPGGTFPVTLVDAKVMAE